MWSTLMLCGLLAMADARPLEWFDEPSEQRADPHAGVPGDLAAQVEAEGGMSPTAGNEGATSFLQVQTGGHPLECDCERVKCNCVKRCECGLPPANQNRQATAFLELIGGQPGDARTPLLVDMDTNECFLETGEKVGQDNHHMLDCECDKVKCNCVKHCECSLPAAGGTSQPSQMLLQSAEGKVENKASLQEEPTNTLLELSEGLKEQPPPDVAVNDVSPAIGPVSNDDDEANEEGDQSTSDFLSRAGATEGPAPDVELSKARSRAVAAKNSKGKSAYEYSYSYGGVSDNAQEPNEPNSEYSYSYSN